MQLSASALCMDYITFNITDEETQMPTMCSRWPPWNQLIKFYYWAKQTRAHEMSYICPSY